VVGKNTTPLLNDTLSSLGKIKLVLSFHGNSTSEIQLSIVTNRLRTLNRRHKTAAAQVLDVRDFWTDNLSRTSTSKIRIHFQCKVPTLVQELIKQQQHHRHNNMTDYFNKIQTIGRTDTEFWLGNVKVNEHWEDLGIDRILK
jgi:hypothetical protein